MTASTSQAQAPQTDREAEWVPVDAVHPWALNPYEHSDAQVRAIMESIQTFGWMRPILARRANGEISAGHGTFAAAKRLGMEKVLVSRAERRAKHGDRSIQNDDLSQEQLRTFLEAFLNVAARRALIAGAATYVAHPPGARSLEFRLAFDAAGYRFHEGLVWNKGTMVLGHSDYHYSHEPIMFGYAPGGGRRGRGGEGWYGDSSQVSVFDVPKPKANPDHPTPKPPELIVAMLKNSCPVDGTVYDPFTGSGSTLVTAESIQRIGHGVELDPRYAAVTLQRFADMGLTPTLDASE